MRDFIGVIIQGAYTNFKRIFFASDRVTDMDLRKKILSGTVEPTKKVDEVACIGCAGCSNVCPTGAVEMVELDEPVVILDDWVKTQIPKYIPEKCVHCYYCHDFCPIYALFGEAGTIHPNDVGEITVDTHSLLEQPYKISDDKIAFISKFLSDKTVLKNREEKQENKL